MVRKPTHDCEGERMISRWCGFRSMGFKVAGSMNRSRAAVARGRPWSAMAMAPKTV